MDAFNGATVEDGTVRGDLGAIKLEVRGWGRSSEGLAGEEASESGELGEGNHFVVNGRMKGYLFVDLFALKASMSGELNLSL